MRFAFLGIDRHVADLAAAVAASGQHELALVWRDHSPWTLDHETIADLKVGVSDAPVAGKWYEALVRAEPDVVVMAAHADATALQANFGRVLPLGHKIVASHPLHLSVMVAYELEMMAANSGCAVIPYNPLRSSAAARRLGELVGAPQNTGSSEILGQLEQITLDRTARSADELTLLHLFAADVDLMRWLAGDIDNVAAMGRARNLVDLPISVQMDSQQGILARWSVTASDERPADRMTVVGALGTATLDMGHHEMWRLTVRTSQQSLDESWAADDKSISLEALSEAIARSDADPPADGRSWQGVTRSLELTEALQKSAKKGRIVHLNYEGRDEQSAFKGTMAALGCSLLVGGLLVTVVAAIVIKLAKVQGLDRLAAVAGWVPYLLLGVMLVFLLLQLLQRIIPVKKDND